MELIAMFAGMLLIPVVVFTTCTLLPFVVLGSAKKLGYLRLVWFGLLAIPGLLLWAGTRWRESAVGHIDPVLLLIAELFIYGLFRVRVKGFPEYGRHSLAQRDEAREKPCPESETRRDA